jgi:hypothetical protein
MRADWNVGGGIELEPGQLWNEFFVMDDQRGVVKWTDSYRVKTDNLSKIEITIVTSCDAKRVGLGTWISEHHDGEVGHRKNCLAGDCTAISSPVISSITYKIKGLPQSRMDATGTRNELDPCPIQRPAVSTTTTDFQFQGRKSL